MKTKEREAENKKYKERFNPFFGIVAQSERRAEGFDHNEHRALGVGTHLDKRSAGNDALLGERNYQKTLQQKPVKQPKGETHKEINYFVDRNGVLFREIKFFDKKGMVLKTTVKRVKKGKVPKELKESVGLALELQSTGGIADAPLGGTRINVREGDFSASKNISGRARQKLIDLAEKKEPKVKEKWYKNFFHIFVVNEKQAKEIKKQEKKEIAKEVKRLDGLKIHQKV